MRADVIARYEQELQKLSVRLKKKCIGCRRNLYTL